MLPSFDDTVHLVGFNSNSSNVQGLIVAYVVHSLAHKFAIKIVLLKPFLSPPLPNSSTTSYKFLATRIYLSTPQLVTMPSFRAVFLLVIVTLATLSLGVLHASTEGVDLSARGHDISSDSPGEIVGGTLGEVTGSSGEVLSLSDVFSSNLDL
ncbi:hypothetical protein C0995_016614 [Termitomyces sp. Mi166|nr:hypothetical protein C0995_016614 [Termitomyces sp. Mi166\